MAADRALNVVPDYDATLELAHLLAILDAAAALLEQNLADIDANILRAHRAQLAAGREWYGMEIYSTTDEVLPGGGC